MKKPLLGILTLLAAGGLFALGWHFGQQSALKLTANVLQTETFNNAYNQITDNYVVVSEIDSGHIEDAKNMLYLSMNGNILALKNTLETTSAIFSARDVKTLLEMDKGNQTQYGSHQETSDKLLARVAKYRADHPWTYTGKMSSSSDPETTAKLNLILKDAVESQK